MNKQEHRVKPTDRTDLRPAIRRAPASRGISFWEDLPPNIRDKVESPISEAERWLMDKYQHGYESPYIPLARFWTGGRQIERQRNPMACTFVAAANAFRILDGQSNYFTSESIRARLSARGIRANELNEEALQALIESGYPYNRFQTGRVARHRGTHELPTDVLKFLNAIDSGSVATLGWKSRPDFGDPPGEPLLHTRTIIGFGIEARTLFFHTIDPFIGTVEQWSFRDLIAATGKSLSLHASNVVRIANASIGREATLIRRKI